MINLIGGKGYLSVIYYSWMFTPLQLISNLALALNILKSTTNLYETYLRTVAHKSPVYIPYAPGGKYILCLKKNIFITEPFKIKW